jgi:hypothetical protein
MLPVSFHRSTSERSSTKSVAGLPIGNVTSQFWANVYLNELDQFVKRSLGCRFYLCYVDDMIPRWGRRAWSARAKRCGGSCVACDPTGPPHGIGRKTLHTTSS